MIRVIDSDWNSRCECIEGWSYKGNKEFSEGECVDDNPCKEPHMIFDGKKCVCEENFFWNDMK